MSSINLYKEKERSIKLQDELTKTRRLLKESTRLNLQQESVINDFLTIKKKPRSVAKLKTTNTPKNTYTPIILWSDWHVEGTVDLNNTQGLNEFNPDIAKKRVDILVKQCVDYIKNIKYKYNECIIWLGGDFIEGWIHDELRETNAMSPIEATQYAIDLLNSAITKVKNIIPKSKKITVLCNYGNHSRITIKMQHGNQEKTNYEHLIYSNLKNTHKDLNFIYTNEIGYYNMKSGGTIRYCHGHQVRSIVQASLQKWKTTIDKYLFADLTIMGHYHTMSMPCKDLVINGSIKGFDEYAYGLGLSYDEPRQGIIVFDNHYKKIKTLEQLVTA